MACQRTAGELLPAYWPGIEALASTIQIESLLTGDEVVRKRAIPALAEGRWEPGRWTWRDTLPGPTARPEGTRSTAESAQFEAPLDASAWASSWLTASPKRTE